MEFCKSFNARTQAQAKDDLIIPVVITVYNDRSFTFITKTPPAAILLKKPRRSKKARASPTRTRSARSPKLRCARSRSSSSPDLNTTNLDSAIRTIEGAARSMGLEVV